MTTLLALGFSVLLMQLAGGASPRSLVRVIGGTLVLSGFLPLVHTRGRHLSWVVLFAAGGLCLASDAP